MNRKIGKFLLGLIIAMIIYNVIVFASPTIHNKTFWISYTFSTVAFLMQIAVCLIAFRGADSMKRKFMGLPFLYIGVYYLITQLIFGVVFMVLTFIPVYVSIIEGVVLLGVFLILLLLSTVAREEVMRVEEKVREKTLYIKTLQTDIELAIEKTDDDRLKKRLIALSNIIRYSDPMSTKALEGIEDKIKEKVTILLQEINLHEDTQINELLLEIEQIIAERNKTCKILK